MPDPHSFLTVWLLFSCIHHISPGKMCKKNANNNAWFHIAMHSVQATKKPKIPSSLNKSTPVRVHNLYPKHYFTKFSNLMKLPKCNSDHEKHQSNNHIAKRLCNLSTAWSPEPSKYTCCIISYQYVCDQLWAKLKCKKLWKKKLPEGSECGEAIGGDHNSDCGSSKCKLADSK